MLGRLVLVGLPCPRGVFLNALCECLANLLQTRRKRTSRKLLLLYKEANETFDGSIMIKHCDVTYGSQDAGADIEGLEDVARYIVEDFIFLVNTETKQNSI